ncbi:glycosyltransferase [Candidatus Halobonum tyrrellensis]|uniref:Dolichol-P-glucose transferase n=1 Tax=Candidatus Halobonum tyrrellensis G22 TaxID=1324957 RepID=V4GXN6_9EURY|nr:glycosyltransferase [Candidatus Halobonum tyrrellensis]ESP89921.1 dolichol-P-glucose transferase [Candidatus Halobonum tyrrellensis G22]
MSPTVGVVVPAYRPRPDRLVGYLRDLRATLDPEEIRVELDVPPGAEPPALDLPPGVDCRVVRRRRGKGAAVTAGFEALSTDVLAFADADGATPADSLADVVDAVRTGGAELGVGSRRHPAADVRSHQTLARRLLGDAFAWAARRLLDAKLYDYQCGAKALSAEAWAAVRDHLYEPGFVWDIELLAVAAALELRVTEVPVTWVDQPGSTVSPVGDTFDMGRGLLVARHRARLIRDDRLHRLLDRSDAPTLVDAPDPERDPATGSGTGTGTGGDAG